MILFAADLHLDLIWQSRPDLEGDAELALNLLCEAALKEAESEKTTVVLGGDVFDSPSPGPGKVWMFQRFVDRLDSAGVSVMGIQGNHDLSSDGRTWIEACGAVRLTASPVDVDGFCVVGVDYERSAERLQEKLANTHPEADMLVAHAPFRHLLNWEGGYQATKDDLPAHLKYALVGDIHKMDGSPFGDAGMFLSPGATHPRNVTEFGAKHGYWRIGRAGRPVWRPLPATRVFATAEVRVKEDLDELKAGMSTLKRAGPKAVLSAKVASSLSVEFDQLMEGFPHVYAIASVFDDSCDYALPVEAGLESREMPELLAAVCQEESTEVRAVLDGLFNSREDSRKTIVEEARKIYGSIPES